MCRLLAYVGPTVPLKSILVEPSNSLVNQSRGPKHHPFLQLAGWGFALWSTKFVDPVEPVIYRRACPAFFDDNLTSLVPALQGELLLAHVRAATYRPEGIVVDENCHPFRFEGAPWTLAHNGFMLDWQVMQSAIFARCKPHWIKQRKGATDTELFYCLFLSVLEEFDDPYDFENLKSALFQSLEFLIETGREFGNTNPIKLKLIFVCENRVLAISYGAGEDGEVNLTGDLQAYREAPIDSPEFLKSTLMEPLYVKTGTPCDKLTGAYELKTCDSKIIDTVFVSSEPLTEDEDSWDQLGFGEMLMVERQADGRCDLTSGNVFS